MFKRLVPILLLVGCDSPKDAVRSVRYYRDTRTDICFASGTFSVGESTSSVFSYVPCEKIPAGMIEDVGQK